MYMFGDQVCVFVQLIIGVFDLYDDSMVKKFVQECGCDNRIFEDFFLFCEVVVGGEDYCFFFIVSVDKLEEQVGFVLGNWQIIDFVDDQQ